MANLETEDVIVMLILLTQLLVHIYLSIQSFKQKEMRNTYNYIVAVCISVCLVNHISYLVYEIITETGINKEDYRNQVYWAYLQFQLPFDLLNISILAHFFQWHELSHTLNYVIDINKRNDSH